MRHTRCIYAGHLTGRGAWNRSRQEEEEAEEDEEEEGGVAADTAPLPPRSAMSWALTAAEVTAASCGLEEACAAAGALAVELSLQHGGALGLSFGAEHESHPAWLEALEAGGGAALAVARLGRELPRGSVLTHVQGVFAATHSSAMQLIRGQEGVRPLTLVREPCMYSVSPCIG